jgi:hypothetical protein
MPSNFQHITIEDDRRDPGRARVVRAALRVEAGHLPPGTRARLVDAVLDCRRPTWHTTRGDSPPETGTMEHRRTIHYDPTRRQRGNRLPGHAKARVSIWSVITDSFSAV